MIFLRKKIDESSYYELYSIASSSFTPPYTLTIPMIHLISTKTCETHQPIRTEHLPKRRLSFLNTSSYYAPHSTDTSSFNPGYALLIPSSHFRATTSNKSQQLTHLGDLPSTSFQIFNKPARTEHLSQRRQRRRWQILLPLLLPPLPLHSNKWS